MLDPIVMRPTDRYATTAEIEACEDLPAMDCTPMLVFKDGTTEPLWRGEDGTPLIIRIRAPSLKQRRLINQASKDDDTQFVLETCLECIVRPKFTRDQLENVLANKHPRALDEISDTAWGLTNLSASLLDAEVRRLAGIAAPTPAES